MSRSIIVHVIMVFCSAWSLNAFSQNNGIHTSVREILFLKNAKVSESFMNKRFAAIIEDFKNKSKTAGDVFVFLDQELTSAAYSEDLYGLVCLRLAIEVQEPDYCSVFLGYGFLEHPGSWRLFLISAYIHSEFVGNSSKGLAQLTNAQQTGMPRVFMAGLKNRMEELKNSPKNPAEQIWVEAISFESSFYRNLLSSF
jgi:hypothetical protein